MWVTLVYASTGTGIENAMTNLVNLVIALCGIGMVGGIGWKGLQFVVAQDWRHAGESLIGVGLGGGMIGFAKPVGTFVMSQALGASLTPLTPRLLSDGLSDLVSLLITNLPIFMVGCAVVAWRRRVRWTAP